MTTFTSDDREEEYKKILAAAPNQPGYEDAVPIPFAGWVNTAPPHIVDSGASVIIKELTDEEILCLWDWWSGEILSTDILDFADTYKRVMQGEEGLLEWHKEYVKKMNEQYPPGKVTEK